MLPRRRAGQRRAAGAGAGSGRTSARALDLVALLVPVKNFRAGIAGVIGGPRKSDLSGTPGLTLRQAPRRPVPEFPHMPLGLVYSEQRSTTQGDLGLVRRPCENPPRVHNFLI